MECNHKLEYCKEVISSGAIWVRRQCVYCGFKGSKVYKKKDIKDLDKIPFLSKELFNSYCEERIKAYEQKQFVYTLRLNYYTEYMSSDEWKAKREEIIHIYNGLCNDCHGEGTDVHHLHYDNFGKEQIEDLVLLCRHCHNIRHIDNPKLTYVYV